MTKLGDFKCDNPQVLMWLKIYNRQKHTTNSTNKFFYNKAQLVVLSMSH